MAIAYIGPGFTPAPSLGMKASFLRSPAGSFVPFSLMQIPGLAGWRILAYLMRGKDLSGAYVYWKTDQPDVNGTQYHGPNTPLSDICVFSGGC
jgi:hypothetical protein